MKAQPKQAKHKADKIKIALGGGDAAPAFKAKKQWPPRNGGKKV